MTFEPIQQAPGPVVEVGGEPEEPRPAPTHRPPGGAIGAILVLTLLIGVVLTAFALPAIHSGPRNVPIGVAGPPAAVAQVTSGLQRNAPGFFAVTGFADQAELTQAIHDRGVYGGIALGPTGLAVLTAPPGSPAVAQGLSALAASLGQQGQRVPVTEVVSLPADDSRGVGLPTALLPLLIAAVAATLAMNRLLVGRWAKLAGVASTAVVLGAALAGLLHWYGIFEGNWFLEAAALAAVVGAMAIALLGLLLVAGMPAFGLGVATFLLLGSPLSGIATAPEFLPEPWQSIGAWLPVGAGGQLLRSAAYFDGARSGQHLLVLAAWMVLGLALVAVARKRRPRPAAA